MSCEQTAKPLVRLRKCGGLPEPWLLAYVLSTQVPISHGLAQMVFQLKNIIFSQYIWVLLWVFHIKSKSVHCKWTDLVWDFLASYLFKIHCRTRLGHNRIFKTLKIFFLNFSVYIKVFNEMWKHCSGNTKFWFSCLTFNWMDAEVDKNVTETNSFILTAY